MESTIDPTSRVSPAAQMGVGCQIGPFTIIHANVILEAQVKVGAYCELGVPSPRGDGTPLVIGANSLIRSHSVFYESSSFGHGLVTGHHVTVREGTKSGIDLQIGTLGDIQGHCLIGDYVRFHSNVHIGHHSKIGDFVWIFPYVVLTNDPHPPSEVQLGVEVEDFAAIATMSVILPGVKIGRGALVGAHSSVGRDVPPDTIVVGSPARTVGPTSKILLRDNSGNPAYPWRRHFHRGYPTEKVEEWKEEFPGR